MYLYLQGVLRTQIMLLNYATHFLPQNHQYFSSQRLNSPQSYGSSLPVSNGDQKKVDLICVLQLVGMLVWEAGVGRERDLGNLYRTRAKPLIHYTFMHSVRENRRGREQLIKCKVSRAEYYTSICSGDLYEVPYTLALASHT